MMTRRSRSILLAAGALAIGAAAIAQDKPESLLPPGFGEPAPTPSATAAVPPPDANGAVVQPLPGVTPLPSPSVSPSPSPSPTSTESPYQLPAFARRPLSRIGIGPSGMPAAAFGGADGRTVEILMRRLSAPLPSRWLSIALRRLLVAPIDTPRELDGADFAAERAWLLLRMGESVAARAVAEGVDTDNVTPKLRQVWMQAALATADPAGLCALAPGAGASERGWVVARAMCATLSGAGDGPALLRDVRRRRIASGIDLQLAQKVMGAGLNSRQAITIDWAPVVQLNAWRFGLATATGVAVPDELYATVGAQVTGWRALAPAIPLAERAAPAETAAAMGVLSNVAMVDLYSAIAEDGDAPAALGGTAETLREAYVGDRPGRLTALRSLWDGASTRAGRHARLVLTARAAAGIVPATETPEADRLVAAMLTAGLDRTAARWRGFVTAGGDGQAMLTLSDPDGPGRPASLDEYAPSGSNSERKKQLYFAGLAGLGRLSPAQVEEAAAALDVRIGVANAWTRAIDRAARDRQVGTVLLLAAIGMQAGDWTGVPPEHLYRIVAALRAVGLSGEARMIAAEAIARL
jgi:hypothetical protein